MSTHQLTESMLGRLPAPSRTPSETLYQVVHYKLHQQARSGLQSGVVALASVPVTRFDDLDDMFDSTVWLPGARRVVVSRPSNLFFAVIDGGFEVTGRLAWRLA